MSWIGWIILITLLAEWLIALIADICNLKAVRVQLPAEFGDVYDAERYRTAQQYLKVRTRFGWIVALFDLALLLLMWFSTGFAVMDQWVRSWQWHPVVSGVAYLGILMLAKAIVGLPFHYWATFVIEARFGFNQTDFPTWVKDKLKALLLGLLLGIPLLVAVLSFFEYAGAMAWLYGWAAATGFVLIVQLVAPTWILPLFNRFEPLPDGDLKTAIFDYARRVDFAVDRIFVMDGSRRSTKANAFFTGFGKRRRIVLFDTLIENHGIDELVAILAHEVGHFKKKHVLQMLALGILQMGVMFFLLSLFIRLPALFEAFFVPNPSVYAGLVFFGLLYRPMDFFLGLGLQALSRHNEFDADRFAGQTAPRPRALADALKKLSAHNLGNLFPHPFYVMLHDSHPPVIQRLRALKEILSRP